MQPIVIESREPYFLDPNVVFVCKRPMVAIERGEYIRLDRLDNAVERGDLVPRKD